MRIAFFDSIEELHVAQGLRHALERRGHEVRWTGLLWHGYDLPSAPDDVRRLDAAVDDVIGWRPDALLTFRAASLTPANLERLRTAGIRTLAWFNDDPVLFGVSTGEVAPLYDMTLHTGGTEVLDLYEQRVGVRGVAFPFYADRVMFPLRYRARTAGRSTPAAAVFLGNTHTRQKQWRYTVLDASGADVVVYGKVRGNTEAFPLHAGYLASVAEVAAMLPRFALGISIPQRFSDYRGTPYDFPGLAELGWFSLPSRVVQMAAVGLPVVDLRPGGPGPRGVPTVEVHDHQQLEDVVDDLARSPRRRAQLSLRGHEWFLRGYTTDARAAFLERVIQDPAGHAALDVGQRATVYRDVPAPPMPSRRERLAGRWG